MRHPASFLFSLAALFLSVLQVAHADIYSFVDEQGVTHFSDIQNDPRFKLVLKDHSLGSRNNASARSHHSVSFSPRIIPDALRQEIDRVAQTHSLDPALLQAVISVESGFNPKAQSPKGARGLMQLMPETAKRYGVRNTFDPRENIRGGAHYLRDLMTLFNNNLELVLAAYNAGENAVIRNGLRIPPYPETQDYVPKVLRHFEAFKTRR